MSIASQLARLRATLPRGWFADQSPVLDSVLTGAAATFDWLDQWLGYVRNQTRLLTATGTWLNRRVTDFLPTFGRKANETDAKFSARASAEVLRPRVTRQAIVQVLTDLTGRTPIIFEPSNATDTGGYDVGGLAYDMAGGYGSLHTPFQYFVTAYRPVGVGIPYFGGYGVALSYTDGGGAYAELSQVSDGVTDAEMFAAVAATTAAGTTAWMQIAAA